MFFLIFCFRGLADPGQNGPPRASQFLQIVKNLPVSISLIHKPRNPKPKSPTLPLRFSYSEPLSICPDHSKARSQANSNGPHASKIIKLFKLANPKPIYPVSSISFHRNDNTYIPPRSFCILINRDAFLCDSLWLGMPPSLGSMSKYTQSFQWRLSPDLLTLSN